VKLGDKAGDGTQLRPFIVWFGEAVPEIETAIQYVEKADIFVIIGTSLNVYPAAGLLHYVPRGAEVYLIDPKPVDTHTSRPIHVIQKGASEGVAELKQLLGV
ncbi:Sir2 family NAD-dependent protein deacetylase, partial [Bacteroides acidifaciens]